MQFVLKKWSLLILNLMVLVSMSGCNMYDKAGGNAFDASNDFFTKFNSGRFSSIYEESDIKFRESISENDFVAKLRGIQEKCGEIGSRLASKYETATRLEKIFPSLKKTRSIEFIGKCEYGGQLKSHFKWYINNRERRLISYEAEYIGKP